MKLRLALACLVASSSLAACPSTDINISNTAPTATILSPEAMSTVISSEGAVSFRGQVRDEQDVPEDLLLQWSSDLDGLLHEEAADTGGLTQFSARDFSFGSHVVELRVTDSGGEIAVDTIDLVVAPGEPVVWISSPLGGSSFQVDTDVDLEGFAEDALGERVSQVTWSYWQFDPAEAVELSVGATDTEGRTALVYDSFPVGSVTVVLRAEDQFGLVGTAEVTIQIEDVPLDQQDRDLDGFTPEEGDCNDGDATVYPGAAEDCDGVDDDCNGVIDDGFDLDADGYSSCGGDCDDGDPSVNPGRAEICDGIDQDCDGTIDEPFNLDGDGFTTCEGDCDDGDDTVYPGAAEVCDLVDNNCNGAIDEGWDIDGDGFTACGGDCQDGDPDINPSAEEVCDALDNNCDGIVDEGYDLDFDGYAPCAGDCNDANPAINPGVTETCDGFDNNCNTLVDEGFDLDADGATSCAGDCDDGDAARSPLLDEVCDDIDNDCDGFVDEIFDVDGDGWTTCAGDCDDTNPSVNPSRPEVCDGVDNNCDFRVDEGFDADGDGFAPCAGDCDDRPGVGAATYPGAVEFCDAIDNDCDGEFNEGFEGTYEAFEDGLGSSGYDLGLVQATPTTGSADCPIGTLGPCPLCVAYGLSYGRESAGGLFHSPTDTIDIYEFENFVSSELVNLLLTITGVGSSPSGCSTGYIRLSGIPSGHDYSLELYEDGLFSTTVGFSDNPGSSDETIVLSRSLLDSIGSDFEIVVNSKGNWGCTSGYTLQLVIP